MAPVAAEIIAGTAAEEGDGDRHRERREQADTGVDPGDDGERDRLGDERQMHTGEVAARTELSLRSLRHWDEVGLLRPTGRTVGGFRLYTEADVEKILVIRRMKPLGFTLGQMSAAMRDLETLHQPGTDEKADARDVCARRRCTSWSAGPSARDEQSPLAVE
jgi:MerR family copper efflux transcriptional regulator